MRQAKSNALLPQIWKDTTELGCAQTYCQPLHDAGNSFSWVGLRLLSLAPLCPGTDARPVCALRTASSMSASTSRPVRWRSRVEYEAVSADPSVSTGNIVGSTPQQTAAFFSANVQK